MRGDCPILIKAYGIDGPWKLPPEWEQILDGGSDDDLAPREELARAEPRIQPDLMEEPVPQSGPLCHYTLIQWTDAERIYHVSLPEREEHIKNPVASAKTYSAAAHEY